MKTFLAPAVVLVSLVAACSVDTSALGLADDVAPPPSTLRADASAAGATPAGPSGEVADASGADAGLVEAGRTDASSRDAATTDASPDAVSPTSCDRDGDGRLSYACGGDDCCDTDARAHRGVTAYFDTPTTCGDYDYDCDGYGYRQYATVTCTFKLLDWCAGEGFQSDTACGEIGTYATCAIQSFSCGPQGAYAARQPCH